MPDTAVVTGASSGIGEQYARQLAARGYDLVLTARRAQLLHELGDELRQRAGVTVEELSADLTVPRDRDRIAERIRQLRIAGQFGVLVNAAGFAVPKAFSEQPYSNHQAMIDVHISAVTQFCHAVADGGGDDVEGQIVGSLGSGRRVADPAAESSSAGESAGSGGSGGSGEPAGGSAADAAGAAAGAAASASSTTSSAAAGAAPPAIINVSSAAAFLGTGIYCAAKLYQINLSRRLARDLRPRRIRVQVLCPGFVHTGFHSTPAYRDSGFREKIPGPLWLTSEYVVHISLRRALRPRRALQFPHSPVCIPALRYKLIVLLAKLGLRQR